MLICLALHRYKHSINCDHCEICILIQDIDIVEKIACKTIELIIYDGLRSLRAGFSGIFFQFGNSFIEFGDFVIFIPLTRYVSGVL